MTTEVVITGTGVPHVDPHRAGAGVLVRHGAIALQIDAGRATAMRLAAVGVRPQHLSAVLLTHHHSDHLLGLTDLVLTRWLEVHTGAAALPVVAPEGPLARFVGRLLDVWDDDIAVRVDHTGRTDRPQVALSTFAADTSASEPVEVWAAGEVRVLARAVHHEPVLPSVAYRIETPDGAVVVSGDTRVCDEVAELAQGAAVLVHEACRSRALGPLVRDTVFEQIYEYHADTVALGALATRVGVPTLVLTHLIPPPTDAASASAFTDDVRAGGYAGEVIVADDLTTITVERP